MKLGVSATPIAMISLSNEPPRAVTMIKAKSSVGNANNMSVTRKITASVPPPLNPAKMPRGTPTMNPTITAPTPTCSDTRVPQMMRLRRSRPNSSVPNKCLPENGPLKTKSENWADGLSGEISGAKMAQRIITTTITMPMPMGMSLRNRRPRSPWSHSCSVGSATNG
jgi:hypothetical protein